MTTPTALPTLPGTPYLRLSDTQLHYVRFEAGADNVYEHTVHPLQPQASLSVNLREMCRHTPELQTPTGGLNVVVCSDVCLVPLSDFQEEDCEALYSACFTEREKQRVFYEVAGAPGIVVLFALSEATCRLLESRFGEVLYRSAVTPLLRHFARKAATGGGGKCVYIYPHDDRTDVFLFDDRRPVAMNTFRTIEPIDIAYYTLNLSARMSFSVQPDTEAEAGTPPPHTADCATLYVAGEEALRDSVADELRKYAADVVPVRPASEYNRHAAALQPDMPYDLLTLLLDA